MGFLVYVNYAARFDDKPRIGDNQGLIKSSIATA